jgi:hypothetical protein
MKWNVSLTGNDARLTAAKFSHWSSICARADRKPASPKRKQNRAADQDQRDRSTGGEDEAIAHRRSSVVFEFLGNDLP